MLEAGNQSVPRRHVSHIDHIPKHHIPLDSMIVDTLDSGELISKDRITLTLHDMRYYSRDMQSLSPEIQTLPLSCNHESKVKYGEKDSGR